MKATRLATAALAVVLAVGLMGCTSAKSTVKQVVQQGIEPTATGPHNTVQANDAQKAVDSANGVINTTGQTNGMSGAGD